MATHSNPDQADTSTKPISDGNPEIPNPSNWHKTSSLPDGTAIGRLGAYWYILDQNRSAVSTGYHEISCDEHGDYIGERSSYIEPVVLYTDPNQL